MAKLKIKVGGHQLDTKSVVNVYRLVHQGEQRVEVFKIGSDGLIVEEGGQPVIISLYGDVEIEGEPMHCGCYRGKRINGWWRRVNEGRPGW